MAEGQVTLKRTLEESSVVEASWLDSQLLKSADITVDVRYELGAVVAPASYGSIKSVIDAPYAAHGYRKDIPAGKALLQKVRRLIRCRVKSI